MKFVMKMRCEAEDQDGTDNLRHRRFPVPILTDEEQLVSETAKSDLSGLSGRILEVVTIELKSEDFDHRRRAEFDSATRNRDAIPH